MTGTPTGPRNSGGRELADQLLGRAEAGGVERHGPDGLPSRVTRGVLERAPTGEVTGHLGCMWQDHPHTESCVLSSASAGSAAYP
jgi:hypothetical protein